MKPTPRQWEKLVPIKNVKRTTILLMSDSFGKSEPAALPVTADKRGLAERYMVGVRTIEEWHGTGIIHGTRQGKRIFFNVGDCDQRLKQFSNQRGTYERN
jgi:hypothetical protein